MEAAFASLRHLPIDLIEKGAKAAQMTADHPAKIVPAIIAATKDDLAWRQRMNAGRPQAEQTAALPAPGDERCTPAEIDAICKQFAVGRYAKASTKGSPHTPLEMPRTADPDRECRAPTREDYIRLFGIDPEAPKPAADSEAA